MSIASELTNLAANRDAIKAAIEAKNPATAPTSALSSFPASIASIPTGGGGWQPPSDWPDLHAILQQYPNGGSDYPKALAVLFDLEAGRTVKLTNCTKVRYSDAPDVVADGTNTGTITHTFSNDAGRYGWAVLYVASNSNYLNPNLGSGVATVIPGTTSSASSIGVLWASGIGRVALTGGSCKSVQCIDTVDDTCIVSSYNNGASSTWGLRAFRVKKAVKQSTTTIRNAFYGCYRLGEIDTSDWDTSGVTSFEGTFEYCGSLESVDITGWDASNATNFSLFANAVALKSVIGQKLYSSLSIDSTKGPKVSFSLSNALNLSADSLRFFVHWVGSVTSATLTLGAVNKAKLTADEIAVATAKGWTVA